MSGIMHTSVTAKGRPDLPGKTGLTQRLGSNSPSAARPDSWLPGSSKWSHQTSPTRHICFQLQATQVYSEAKTASMNTTCRGSRVFVS